MCKSFVLPTTSAPQQLFWRMKKKVTDWPQNAPATQTRKLGIEHSHGTHNSETCTELDGDSVQPARGLVWYHPFVSTILYCPTRVGRQYKERVHISCDEYHYWPALYKKKIKQSRFLYFMVLCEDKVYYYHHYYYYDYNSSPDCWNTSLSLDRLVWNVGDYFEPTSSTK